MGKLIGWLLGVPFAAIAVVFAVSNRALVVADLWPLPWAVQAPLYLFVLVALAVGFLAGGFIAWVGSLAVRRRIRAEARAEGAKQWNAEGAKQWNAPWTTDGATQRGAAGRPPASLPAPPPI